MFEHICIFQAPHLPNTFGRFKCYFIVFKIRKLLLQFERGGGKRGRQKRNKNQTSENVRF